MSVVEDAFKKATSSLVFWKRTDRLRGVFVRRRAVHLHAAHSTWNATKLATHLSAEVTVVEDYLATKDAIRQGTETASPAHLDLADMAHVKDGLGTFAHAPLETAYRDDRASWIEQIVWRALAIHPTLWASIGPPPTLELAALDEILDRRLRAIEQLACNVNSGDQVAALGRTWTVTSENGPWTDDFLVRNFEYPYLPYDPFKAVATKMVNWVQTGSNLLFSPPAGSGQAPIRFSTSIQNAWQVRPTAGGTMWVVYVPKTSRDPVSVIHRMFDPPRSDWYARNWLYCDMVGSALNVEALRFGLRRRDGNDDVFKAVMNTLDYVQLGPVVQYDNTHDLDQLMADDVDPHFENLDLAFDDLQVGDFVTFWNCRLYMLLQSGAWANEFSHVMGVDADAATGKVKISATSGPAIDVAGHGVATKTYNSMAAELIDSLRQPLLDLGTAVTTAVTATPSTTSITYSSTVTLVKWEPYEAFDSPGAWWVEIPPAVWQTEWDFATTADVMAAIPRTVAAETSPGTGYTAPPHADHIYFPVFEPAVAKTDADGDSWRAYLRKRKATATYRVATKLKPLAIDQRLATGLFYRGTSGKIPVVRPKVRP